jgi:hypothetical protein
LYTQVAYAPQKKGFVACKQVIFVTLFASLKRGELPSVLQKNDLVNVKKDTLAGVHPPLVNSHYVWLFKIV